MGKPLPIVYCRACGCSHEPGKHSNRPRDLNPVLQKPVPKPSPVAQKAKKPLCSNCGLEDGACICAHLGGPKAKAPRKVKSKPKRKRKPRKDRFDKVHYQSGYMRDRREADLAGFGGSRNRNDPKFNPEYLTVKQWLAYMAAKDV